jgi:hypothetical protein
MKTINAKEEIVALFVKKKMLHQLKEGKEISHGDYLKYLLEKEE